jgi:tetratricopeptide (TPR) repeat protein
MLAKAYQGLGILLSAQQQYEASLGYYKIALKNFILLATEYRYDIAQVYYNMGNDSYNLTLYEDAKIYYTQSLEAYTLLEDVLKKGEIYQNLGNVCYYLDDLEGSMSWDFEAIKLFVNFSMKKEIAEILFNALNLSLEMKDKTHYNKIWSYLEMSFSAEDLQDILRLTTLL